MKALSSNRWTLSFSHLHHLYVHHLYLLLFIPPINLIDELSFVVQQWKDDISCDDALALAAKVLIKTMDTATPSSQRLEFAVITRDEKSEKTTQRMLSAEEIDQLLKTAVEEQKEQQKETGAASSI